MSDKKGLLPFVEKGTLELMVEELAMDIFDEKRDGDVLRNYLERVREDNPYLVEYIMTRAKDSKDRESTALVAIMIYRLLEKQSELDFNKSYRA